MLQGGADAAGGRTRVSGPGPAETNRKSPAAPRRPETIGEPIRNSEHHRVWRTANGYVIASRDERGREALLAAARSPELAAAAASTQGAWIETDDPFALVRTVEEAENRALSAEVLDYNTGGKPDWKD